MTVKVWRLGRNEAGEQEYLANGVGHWKWPHSCDGRCHSTLYPPNCDHKVQTAYFDKEKRFMYDAIVCADTAIELEEYLTGSMNFNDCTAPDCVEEEVLEYDDMDDEDIVDSYRQAINELIVIAENAGVKIGKKYKDLVI